MRPLTDTCPKPLIPVLGKPILQHIIERLPVEIDEVVLIVGYLKEQIEAYFGTSFNGRRIVYRAQENFAGGTGDALLCAKDVLKNKFLFMYGDDIHGRDALSLAIKEDHAILSTHSDTPERFGVLIPNAEGMLEAIIEKPEIPPSNLINIGGFVMNESIFEYMVPVSKSGELYVTDMFTEYAKHNPVKIITQDVWIPIGYPEDIEKAEKALTS